MEIPASLQSKIIEFLQSLPNMDDTRSRQAFIYSIGLDRELTMRISFDDPPSQFVPLVVTILLEYGKLRDGRNAVEAVLVRAKDFVGRDQQDVASSLIRELGGNIEPNVREAIVFDESYRQSEWHARPTTNLGYSTVVEELSRSFNVISNKDGYSSQTPLSPNGILILPTPFGTYVDESEYEYIDQWVYNGGRLLASGIYLMEGHHYNNFNKLIRRFGFEFSQDLTMPVGKESFRDCMGQVFAYAERDFWILTHINGTPVEHPIMEGVSELALTSSCSVNCAANTELRISTSDAVAVMHAKGFKEPSTGRLRQLTDYKRDKYDRVVFAVALTYGAGKIVGVGTWKFFLNTFVKAYPNGNGRFFYNIIKWLRKE